MLRVPAALALPLLTVLALEAGCAGEAAPEPGPEARSEPEAASEPEAEPEAKATPESPGSVGVEPESEAPTEPPAPSFDAQQVRAARVRIVDVPGQQRAPCGIVHSVGAIEVEVLEVGEPPPQMILYVSCPVDVGRGVLQVGKILDVKLHRRRQPWPKPRIELPEGVPVRYVSSLKSVPG